MMQITTALMAPSSFSTPSSTPRFCEGEHLKKVCIALILFVGIASSIPAAAAQQSTQTDPVPTFEDDLTLLRENGMGGLVDDYQREQLKLQQTGGGAVGGEKILGSSPLC